MNYRYVLMERCRGIVVVKNDDVGGLIMNSWLNPFRVGLHMYVESEQL